MVKWGEGGATNVHVRVMVGGNMVESIKKPKKKSITASRDNPDNISGTEHGAPKDSRAQRLSKLSN